MKRDIAVMLLMFTAACGQNTRPVSVEMKVGQTGTKAQALEEQINRSAGADALVVSSVSLTLQDVDLERTEQSIDCSEAPDSEEHQDCSDWEAGPFRIDLNLDPNATGHAITLNAAAGTYDSISFDISVPDGGDPEELAYLEKHPDLAGSSVLVKGTFNGAAFVYKTDVRGDQEVAITPALNVTTGSEVPLNLDVAFDVGRWFDRADGTLIDPRNPNAEDAEQIRANIRRSIESDSAED